MAEVEVPRLDAVLESFVCRRHLLGPVAHYSGYSHVCLKVGDHVTCECPCGKAWWPLPSAVVDTVLEQERSYREAGRCGVCGQVGLASCTLGC